jgi:hypothetical protein
MKLMKPLVFAALSIASLPAFPRFTYAATLNQNLWNSSAPRPAMLAGERVLPVVVRPAPERRQLLAQAKTKPPQPTPATVSGPSTTDVINRLLSPGPSDPNAPLPRADLAGETAESGALKKPQIFGRQEEGGGVLGLRVPIPADRNASGAATRYSPTPSSAGPAQ